MPQAMTSLRRRKSPLADADEQLRILSSPIRREAAVGKVSFTEHLRNHGLQPLTADGIDILQVNVGKLCNMTCRHCHVDAGPDRRELMTRETIDACLAAVKSAHIGTLDLTGGAPEMNPDFRYFVKAARSLGLHVIDRCNLTILLVNGYHDMPEFLAEHEVEVVASLPCYLESNTDHQRGDGAYRESINALRRLNDLGYGRPDSPLRLTLVFNPISASLPPNQQQLEAQYRQHLQREHGVIFSRLFTITNMPISRFLEDLIEQEKYDQYMQTLIEAFNPAAVDGLMCRHTVSVGWDGQLYDCDFNQMLELSTQENVPQNIRDFDALLLSSRKIAVGRHCFGCTAGAGSGCQGAIDA